MTHAPRKDEFRRNPPSYTTEVCRSGLLQETARITIECTCDAAVIGTGLEILGVCEVAFVLDDDLSPEAAPTGWLATGWLAWRDQFVIYNDTRFMCVCLS